MEAVPRLIECNESSLPKVLQELIDYCRNSISEAPKSITLDTKTGIYFFEFSSFILNLIVDEQSKQLFIKNVKSVGGTDSATNAMLNLVYIAKDLGYQKISALDVKKGAMEYWTTVLNFEQIDETTAARDVQKAEFFDW